MKGGLGIRFGGSPPSWTLTMAGEAGGAVALAPPLNINPAPRGRRQMARSVRQSVPLDDVQARAAIRSDLNLVRKIMRRLQQVLERRTSLDESLLVAHLAVVAALARQLPAAEGGTSRTRGTVRPDAPAGGAADAES